jgi:integrase
MPHFPKPFFRPARNLWYVQLAGRQINLGPDRAEAFKNYHLLMAEQRATPQPPVPAAARADECPLAVVQLVDRFLDFVQKHRSADTYRWYKDRLNLFCNAIPADLTIDELKPFHVQQWVDSCPGLASGSKRNHCRSVVRAMRWAEQQGYVDRSPLTHFQKPPAGKKEQVVTAGEYAKLLAHTRDQAFKDLLTVTWETGARPQETLRVEARHVDVPNGRWVFPAGEAKGGRLPRVGTLASATAVPCCGPFLVSSS